MTTTLPEDDTNRPRQLSRKQWLFALLLVLALIGLRFIHLSADMPPWVSPHSAGAYVDEGYKTLSPRNLVVFGQTHWNPSDDYQGWMKISPLTNWPYYVAFRLFGANVEAVRLITVLCYAILLSAYLWGMSGRYHVTQVLLGLTILGLDSVLFFFSRTALFEIPMSLFLYWLLFYFARTNTRGIWGPLVATLLVAPVLALGIKLSAFLYLLPVAVGLLLRTAYLRGLPRGSRVVGILAVAVLVGAVVPLLAFREIWLERIVLNPLSICFNIFSSPIIWLSPFLVLAGVLCSIHLLLCRTGCVLSSAYRMAVISIALLGPLLLGLFTYDPPRYFVPIVPAYVLVILEWMHLRGRSFEVPDDSRWNAFLSVAGLSLWWFWVVRAFNEVVLENLPLAMGGGPGPGAYSLFCFASLPAIGLACATWCLRGRLLTGSVVSRTVLVCLGLFALNSAVTLGHFMLAPRYQSRSVREQIVHLVPPGSSLIGDWAPFFALGTDLPALYMAPGLNDVARVTELRPDYFLHSDTPGSKVARAEFEKRRDVQLGPVLLESEYNLKSVTLFRIQYQDAAESSTPPRADPAD